MTTDWITRIRGEYLEMPGLRLTLAQAARFWTLDRSACARLLDGLVDTGFLMRTRDGLYARTTLTRASMPESADADALTPTLVSR